MPEARASLPTWTMHGYLAGVGAAAALLAAAVLAFMVLVGMVSFNLWPQATPRGPGPSTQLRSPEPDAVALPSALSLAAPLLASADPLQPTPPTDTPSGRGDAGISPAAPTIEDEAPTAPVEDQKRGGGGDQERGSGGGSSQGSRGQGNANGHEKGARLGNGRKRGQQGGRRGRGRVAPGDSSRGRKGSGRRAARKAGARRRGRPARGPGSRGFGRPGRRSKA